MAYRIKEERQFLSKFFSRALKSLTENLIDEFTSTNAKQNFHFPIRIEQPYFLQKRNDLKRVSTIACSVV